MLDVLVTIVLGIVLFYVVAWVGIRFLVSPIGAVVVIPFYGVAYGLAWLVLRFYVVAALFLESIGTVLSKVLGAQHRVARGYQAMLHRI